MTAGTLSGYSTVAHRNDGRLVDTYDETGAEHGRRDGRRRFEFDGAVAGRWPCTIGATTSALKLDAASTATSVTFTAAGTLELNTAATLTLTTAMAIGAGTVKLDGAASALTDGGDFTIATGTITGIGTVTGTVAAGASAGHITANGGALIMASAVPGTALIMGASSNTGTLQLDGAATRLQP